MKLSRLLLIVCCTILSFTIHGQLEPGTLAPDFTVIDLDGNEYTLSQLTSSGQHVLLLFGSSSDAATWEYLQSNALQDYYAYHGPEGGNDASVFFIESDPNSSLNELYGIGSNSQGSFVSLTTFPIIHDEQDLNLTYAINNYPTLYKVCPNNILADVGLLTYEELQAELVLACEEVPNNNNPSIYEFYFTFNCPTATATVLLYNMGLDPIVNCTFLLTATNGLSQTIEWSGYLLSSETTIVELGTFENSTTELFTVQIVSADDWIEPPHETYLFATNTSTSHVQIDFLSSSSSNGISWLIFNSNDEVVATYEANIEPYSQVLTDVYLDVEDCYYIMIIDDYGDSFTWPNSPSGHLYVHSVSADGVLSPLFLYNADYAFNILRIGFDVTETVPPIINGKVFQDNNENGILDSGELGIGGVEVHLDNLITYTNEYGMYMFTNVEPSASQLSIVYNETTFPTSTTPTSFSIDGSEFTFNFGLSQNEPLYNLDYSYSDPWFFCSFDGTIYFNVENTGNQMSNGYVSITLDPLLTYISSSPTPTSIVENVISWDLSDVGLGEVGFFSVQILNPGFEQMGQNIVNQIELITYDDQGNVAGTDEGTYPTVLACSYDPNDKAGTPSGETDSHFIENGTELEYLIRFQNTGNYQAFNIHVLDVIDEDLDLNSMEIISTSHYCQPTINAETREVDFFFPDIMLADSTSNEPASHGFIRYRVLPNPNLAEMTTIENTANIYFDFNPPVVTNTTLHTISDLYFGIEEVNLARLPVYPNPTNNLVTINLPMQIDNFDIEVVDLQGRVVKRISENYNSIMTLSCSDLSEGTYLVRIISDGKLIYKPAQLNVIR